jgi:hypothetical protein
MVDFDSFKYSCLEVCDDLKFDCFKRNPGITSVVDQTENASNLTQMYQETLVKKYSFLFEILPWELFAENDNIGSPLVFPTPLLEPYMTRSSHTTLSYIFNSLDIYHHIIKQYEEGDLPESLKIVEIGCGYGGRCKILSNLLYSMGVSSIDYLVIDFPEVLMLTEKYLTCDKITNESLVKYDHDTLVNSQFDLCISFLHLGNVSKSLQDTYIDTYLSKSKISYLTWNNKILGENMNRFNFDVSVIEPKFDVMSTVLTYPQRMSTNFNSIFQPSSIDSLFMQDYKYSMENGCFNTLSSLVGIIANSRELPEAGIMNSQFNSIPKVNNRQSDLYFLSKMCKNILNIGFNGGYSTLIMLVSNPTVKVVCVDDMEHLYTSDCYKYLKSVFGGRIKLIQGDSIEILNNIKSEKFDMVNIDGGRSMRNMNLDFWNSKGLCKEHAYIVWTNLDQNNGNMLWDGYKRDNHITTFSLESSDHLLGQYS